MSANLYTVPPTGTIVYIYTYTIWYTYTYQYTIPRDLGSFKARTPEEQGYEIPAAGKGRKFVFLQNFNYYDVGLAIYF